MVLMSNVRGVSDGSVSRDDSTFRRYLLDVGKNVFSSLNHFYVDRNDRVDAFKTNVSKKSSIAPSSVDPMERSAMSSTGPT